MTPEEQQVYSLLALPVLLFVMFLWWAIESLVIALKHKDGQP